MVIKEIENRAEWDNFVTSFDKSQLLLSWLWGEFQKNLGKKIWRLGFYQEDTLIGVSLVIRNPLPLNFTYLYTPRSPLVRDLSSFSGDELETYMTNLGKANNSVFWKTDILDQDSLGLSHFQKTEDLQPSQTLILDLGHTEEELLASFHKKTRYNIRLSKKKNVEIDKQRPNDSETFLGILKETTARDKFAGHSQSYYQKLTSLDENFAKLYFATHEGDTLVGNLLTYYGDTVTYLHGASSNNKRNTMAPFALQWESILEAKELGFKYYDFWGIDEKKWPGVTRFKRGFVNENNGYEINYPGTYDLPLKPIVYFAYKILKKIRSFL